MQTIIFNLNDKININEPISLCLGYFDGLHIGHRLLIDEAVKSNYAPALLTFEFDEHIFLKNKKYITSLLDKEILCENYGLKYLFILHFDQKVMNLTPEEFIDQVIKKLNAKEVIVGEDFSFGKNAQGNIKTLKEFADFLLKVVPELKEDGFKVGTSRIIDLIEKGNISEANKLLGYSYQITGIVQNGFHTGTNHHFPTANIKLNNYVIPKFGVYASKVKIEGKEYLSMTNIGLHPTINELKDALLEVYIFDFQQDIYGKNISVQLIDFIREEKKFPNAENLYKQIEQDKMTCLKILKK